MVIFHSYVKLPEGIWIYLIFLVVEPTPELVSWDVDIPNIWENKNVPNHQPVIIFAERVQNIER